MLIFNKGILGSKAFEYIQAANGDELDPNTVYIYNTNVDEFSWLFDTGATNYQVDYGDGDVDSYTSGASSATKTYASTGDYLIKFIFDDISDVERFRITGYTGTSYLIANATQLSMLEEFIATSTPLSGTLALSSDNLDDVTVNSCDVTILDLTGTTMVANHDIRMNAAAVATFVPPTTVSGNLTLFDCRFSDVTEVDFTVWGNFFGGSLFLNNSGDLETIICPSCTRVATRFYAYNCANLSSVDIEDWVGMAGDIRIFSNPLLATLPLPASAEVITNLWLLSCALPDLDITPLTGSNDGINIRLENNSFDAAAVNQLLVDLDAKGWINGSVNVSGTGMSAPDGTSGGNDGLTAITNLTGKGWTVTTN